MDSSDTQSLSADEIDRLVSVVIEDAGRELTRPQFNDVVLGLFENIAGLECLPHKRRQRYLKLLWLKYQQATLANPSRH